MLDAIEYTDEAGIVEVVDQCRVRRRECSWLGVLDDRSGQTARLLPATFSQDFEVGLMVAGPMRMRGLGVWLSRCRRKSMSQLTSEALMKLL